MASKAKTGLETNPATNVKPRSAELNASYVGDGTHTTYFFEWGTHRVYGNSTSVQDAGSPTGPQNLPPANLTNLELETVYHYRVVATNTIGTTDGTTTTAAGTRVFFTSGPSASGGTGSVFVLNPSGFGSFQGNTVPYFQYTPLIASGDTSAAKTWVFLLG